MSFGLANAPATFQRLIDKIITPNSQPNIFCNLDDVTVVTTNFKEYLKYLETVAEKINKAKLTISL